jgi:DNA-binding response OmpR family regulator
MPRILIVDGDETMRSAIKEHLLDAYDIMETGIPGNALAMTVEHAPDAILLGLSMPDLLGFELSEMISSLDKIQQTPIFVIGDEDERKKVFCENSGVSRYFTKPIDFAELSRRLESELHSRTVERRVGERIQLTAPLILRGTSKDGTNFAVRAASENMSRGGFLCASPFSFEEATTVDVTLCGGRTNWDGHA